MLDVRLSDLVAEGCTLALVMQASRLWRVAGARCGAVPACKLLVEGSASSACAAPPPGQFGSHMAEMFKCCPAMRRLDTLLICVDAVYK